MHTHSAQNWKHSHKFSDHNTQKAERRTLIVLILTLVTMVGEIISGIAFGSVALLADGLHMGSHATALAINAFAYIYARKHSQNPTFVFGTGKVNALGGYTGAILLTIFAMAMAWEGLDKLLNPTHIEFNWAIAVAFIGLIVNVASVLILGDGEHHHHHGEESHHHNHDHEDLNMRSAYLHVLADAVTSVLAIGALLIGKYWGALWLDPLMGFVGATLIITWAWGLLRESSNRLLDHKASEHIYKEVQNTIESQDDNRLYDLHIWMITPGTYAAIIGIVTNEPQNPDHYKRMIPDHLNIKHVTIETQRCEGPEDSAENAA